MLFLISRLPAVGELRQELADTLDVRICPDVYRHATTGERLGLGYFSNFDVMSKCRMGYLQFDSGLAGGERSHSHTLYDN